MSSFLDCLRSIIGRRKGRAARVVVFDVSMQTDNLGDFIIMRYCMRELRELFGNAAFTHIPTHRPPTDEELEAIGNADFKVVCGTNIVCPNIERYSLWKLPPNTSAYRDVIAMGVGMNSYGSMTQASVDFFRQVFDGPVPVSARDEYTARTLSEAGFAHATNTNCVTMWRLTDDVLARVPECPRRDVVFTLTAHRRNEDADRALIQALSTCYEHLHFWPQGDRDQAYLEELGVGEAVAVLPRTLEAYDKLLATNAVDYVGTRLHGGIHALNAGARTYVVPVDNRATEIQRDTGLAALDRDLPVEDMVARLRAPYDAGLRINWDRIAMWKDAVRAYVSTHL